MASRSNSANCLLATRTYGFAADDDVDTRCHWRRDQARRQRMLSTSFCRRLQNSTFRTEDYRSPACVSSLATQ